MRCCSRVIRTLLPGAIFFVCLVVPSLAQEPPPSSGAVIRSQSSLVLIDVLAQDITTGMAIRDLKQEDFALFVDDRRVPIKSFGQGTDAQARPVHLWLIAECPTRAGKSSDSNFLAGNLASLHQAVSHLNPQDVVYAAHWCPGGETQIDSTSSADRESAFTVLDALSKRAPVPREESASSRAIVKLASEITGTIHLKEQSSLPVLIFLNEDRTALPSSDLQAFFNNLLRVSAMVYGLNVGGPKESHFDGISETGIIRSVSSRTGGRIAVVKHDDYGKELSRIFDELHFRYQLGFAPEALDGKRHLIKVSLSSRAFPKHSSVLFSHRGSFIASPNGGPVSQSEEEQVSAVEFDSALLRAVTEDKDLNELPFEISGEKTLTIPQKARLTLKIDARALSWRKNEAGELRAQLTLVMANISSERTAIHYDSHVLDVQPAKDDNADPPVQPVPLILTSPIPEFVPRLRFVLRDDLSGKVGAHDIVVKNLK